jgi:hypothetical protein
VPVGVVDGLEVVQVHDRDGQGLLLAFGAFELPFESFVEVAAVVRPGQRVANGLFAQLRLERLHLVDPRLKLPVGILQGKFRPLAGGHVAPDDQTSQQSVLFIADSV